MLSPFTTLIVAVTSQAGKFSNRRWMTGAATCSSMIDAGPFLLDTRLWMGQIERGGNPGIGRVTTLATGTESVKMEARVSVTGHTLG